MDASTKNLKQVIDGINREINLLQSSNVEIIGKIAELNNREKLNTTQIQDTSNLKSNYKEFVNEFNLNTVKMNNKFTEYENKLTDLSNTVTKSLTDSNTKYTNLIEKQKNDNDNEIANINSKLEKQLALFRTELDSQKEHINAQISLKMSNYDSLLNSHTTTLDAKLNDSLNKLKWLDTEFKSVKESLIF